MRKFKKKKEELKMMFRKMVDDRKFVNVNLEELIENSDRYKKGIDELQSIDDHIKTLLDAKQQYLDTVTLYTDKIRDSFNDLKKLGFDHGYDAKQYVQEQLSVEPCPECGSIEECLCKKMNEPLDKTEEV